MIYRMLKLALATGVAIWVQAPCRAAANTVPQTAGMDFLAEPAALLVVGGLLVAVSRLRRRR